MLRLQRAHYKPLLSIGIPIMIGQVAIVLVSFVDNIMVGNHSLDELSQPITRVGDGLFVRLDPSRCGVAQA